MGQIGARRGTNPELRRASCNNRGSNPERGRSHITSVDRPPSSFSAQDTQLQDWSSYDLLIQMKLQHIEWVLQPMIRLQCRQVLGRQVEGGHGCPPRQDVPVGVNHCGRLGILGLTAEQHSGPTVLIENKVCLPQRRTKAWIWENFQTPPGAFREGLKDSQIKRFPDRQLVGGPGTQTRLKF